VHTRNSIITVIVILILSAGTFCEVFASSIYKYGGTFDLPIPANPDDTRGWMEDAIIEVPDHFNICDIDVAVSLRHTNVVDLQIFIQSPDETSLCLNMYDFKDFFKGEDYTQTTFDDEAQIPIEQGRPPFTGRFRPKALDPNNLLQVFDGQDCYGTWRLRIYDAYYHDIGTLDSFEIMVTVPEPATAILLALGTAIVRLLARR
jgi:subtilisin-like proprotein convertase family protein